jgi:hypothetical protein
MHPTPCHNGHTQDHERFPVGPRFALPSANGCNGSQVHEAPSPNGANGDQDTSNTPSPNGRDGRGRFTKGNRGGPGNPFARRVARLRTLLLEIVGDEDLRGVLRKLVERAQAGDLAAARLVLDYLIGRPAEAVDPDRLDLEEWRLLQASPTVGEVMDRQPQTLDAAFACELARSFQEHKQQKVLDAVREARAAAKH